MKKLRMIITAAIVLAIVGGAFSSKTKGFYFCVKTGTMTGNCTTIKQNFRITTTGGSTTDYRYYPTWDGDPIECTRAGNNKCTAQFKLIPQGI